MIKFWNGKTYSCKICCDVVLTWLVGIFAQKFKGYQITHAFIYPELKVVVRVTVKSLPKSENSSLLKQFTQNSILKFFVHDFLI